MGINLIGNTGLFWNCAEQKIESITRLHSFLTCSMRNTVFVMLALVFYCAYGGNLLAQEVFTLSHDGLERTYLLDVPDADTEGLPLVLVLHAYVSSANIIRGYSGWTNVAENGEAVICYPQGTSDDLGVNHWNANLGISDTDDIGFLSSLVETLQEQYGLSASCTFALRHVEWGLHELYPGL